MPEDTQRLDAAKAAADEDRPTAAVFLLRQIEREGKLSDFGRFLLADCLRIIGRCTEAMAIFRELLEDHVPEEKKWGVYLRIGMIHAERGELADAELAYRMAVKLRGETTVTWIYLSTILTRMERFEEACAILSEAIAREGDKDEAYLNLAYAMRALERLEDARTALQAALKINPDYDEAYAALRDVEDAIRLRKGR